MDGEGWEGWDSVLVGCWIEAGGLGISIGLTLACPIGNGGRIIRMVHHHCLASCRDRSEDATTLRYSPKTSSCLYVSTKCFQITFPRHLR